MTTPKLEIDKVTATIKEAFNVKAE